MALWIKICGLRSPEAVDAAVAAGADAIGFVFHPASPRYLTPAQAAKLAERVPAGVSVVAVMRHPAPSQLKALFSTFQPDILQTDAGDFLDVTVPSGVRPLPVYRAGGPLPAALPFWCLFEGAQSGQGQTVDWVDAEALARRTQLVLAGGLNPANVAAAVAAVRPAGIDVSTGVERAPGIKDTDLIRQFVATARAVADPLIQ
jgi:phosphoribosylanthranilate isomerase